LENGYQRRRSIGCNSHCGDSIALKGRVMLAQGNALGESTREGMS